jgi:hypothetical protein
VLGESVFINLAILVDLPCVRYRGINCSPTGAREAYRIFWCTERYVPRPLRVWSLKSRLVYEVGGVSNCLVVAVVADRVIIRPFFPFNLMLLPEFYGLEFDVPTERLLNVTTRRLMFRVAIDVEIRCDDGAIEVVTLYIRNSDRFLAVVASKE